MFTVETKTGRQARQAMRMGMRMDDRMCMCSRMSFACCRNVPC